MLYNSNSYYYKTLNTNPYTYNNKKIVFFSLPKNNKLYSRTTSLNLNLFQKQIISKYLNKSVGFFFFLTAMILIVTLFLSLETSNPISDTLSNDRIGLPVFFFKRYLFLSIKSKLEQPCLPSLKGHFNLTNNKGFQLYKISKLSTFSYFKPFNSKFSKELSVSFNKNFKKLYTTKKYKDYYRSQHTTFKK